MAGNNINFRISAVDDFSRNMKRFSNSVKNMSDSTRHMADEMKNAYKSVKESMDVFKGQQMAVEYQFFKLGQSSDEYAGKTSSLMDKIKNLGKEHKTATDNMLKANTLLKSQMYQTAGSFLNLSTQAEKISANYDRMANPIYKINQAGLAAAHGMNKLANSGKAAVLAIKLLGPTANMKELYDMQQMITRGLMRFQMVALGALVTSALVYGGLHKAAMDTVKGYEEAFNRMKAAVRTAFQPMVDVFGMVMMKIYAFITAIANMVIAFNEAHPVLAKIIQGIMMLVPALTLLLSPLAIGIGLVAGFHAAWAYVWTMIAPLITGLAAMSATVWLVAAAIVGLTAGFVIAYQKIEWFRVMVDTAWAWIKNAFMTALNFIKSVVVSVMTALSSFFSGELAKIKAFWDANGKSIMTIVKIFLAFVVGHIRMQMAVIQAVMTVAWNVIKAIVTTVWNVIKGVISGALQMILGIIKVFVSVLKGDWEGAWEGVKEITEGAIKALESIVKGTFEIGKNIVMGLIDGIKSAAGKLMETAKGIANSIKKTIKGALDIHSPSRVMMELGAFTGEGFANGLASMVKAVGGVSTDLASAAVPNASIVKVAERSSEPQQTNSETISMAGMFEGAIFNVRDDKDIAKLAREIGNYMKATARRGAVT